MGYSVYGARREHMVRVLAAIEAALLEQGYKGARVGAAAEAFESSIRKAAL